MKTIRFGLFVFFTFVIVSITASVRADNIWNPLDYPGIQAGNTHVSGVYSNKIVGYYWGGSWEGFSYDGTSWATLNYPDSSLTQAYGVSDNNIVGYCLSDGYYHGFLYNGSTWKNLVYPSSNDTHVSGISGNSVVGWSGVNGFVYNGVSYTTLDYPSADNTRLTGIYDNDIVGYYSKGGNYHGLLYNGTSWTSLDYPGSGNSNTICYGTFENDIVGQYKDGSGQTHGFLYDGSNWSTLDYPGARNTGLYGISGNKIVGWYNDYASANSYSFQLTQSVPEPTSLALLFVGLTTLLAGRFVFRHKK